jgi:hypothetical protein
MAQLRCVRAFVGFGQSFNPGDVCEMEAAQAAEALANFGEFFVAADEPVHEPEHEGN